MRTLQGLGVLILLAAAGITNGSGSLSAQTAIELKRLDPAPLPDSSDTYASQRPS